MDPLNQTNNCTPIDDFRNQVYTTSYSIVTVVGLLGNGLALVVLMKTGNQNSPFHVYMMNLAVSDLLFVLTLPMRILYYAKNGQWDYGDFLCRISSYTLYVNLYCSIYLMAAMSVTRFMAIVFPVQNMRLVTVNRARLVCFGVWLFISLSASPFLKSGQEKDPTTNKTKCFDLPSNKQNWQKLRMMNHFSLVVGFILPFLVILLCYAGIIHALMSRTSAAARRQSETGAKAIKMIVIVLLTFLVSFAPYHIQRTIYLSLTGPEQTCAGVGMQKSVVVTLSLAAANTCFDPMLYFFSGESFRKRLSSIRLSMKQVNRSQVDSQTM